MKIGWWAKLPSGDWGVRVDGEARPGDEVMVHRKDGQRHTVKIGEIVKIRPFDHMMRGKR